MNKTLDTDKYTIGELLGRYERRQVRLPPFQRSYSWEKAQVNQFIDDLIHFENEYSKSPQVASYFLGSIVVINREDHILLLDGQQRLATATICFAAMRDAARRLDTAGGIKGSDLARDIQSELIEKDTDPATYSLTLSELDETFFLKCIKSDPHTEPESKLRSHCLIENTYQIVAERISSIVSGKEYAETIRILKSLKDAIAKGMTLIGIVVQDEEDAYSIFETLNDRGLRLSVPDLVLNLLMKRAPDDTARQLTRDHWNSMLRQMGKRDVSRFLRHLWVSIFGDLKNEGLYSAIKRYLDDSKLTSTEFAEMCADECESYIALLDINIQAEKEALSDLAGVVKYLQISSAPPLLLSGYRCFNQADFAKLLKAVLVTHIRYVLVANQNPLDLESVFYEAARGIRDLASKSESSSKQLQSVKARLKRLAVTNEDVEKAAKDLTMERTEAVWLMVQIANSMQSATREVGMDKANLEHVFPQNAGTAWPNKVQLESYIWHIGNLTILGERLNRNSKNKGFAEKCSNYYSKSEIKMTKEILKARQWDENAVMERARDLAGKIAGIWPAL